MPAPELTEEDIMNNDVDPLEGIRDIRREEGVAEEDLPERDDGADHARIEEKQEEETKNDNDDGELDDNLQANDDDNDDDELSDVEKAAAETKKAADAAIDAANEAADVAAGKKPDEKKADDEDEDPDKAADKADDKEGDAEEASAETVKFRANGQDFEFTQEEIMQQFETVFGQAANYTQKMQKIAPYRKMISALEQEGVTHDNLNLALDALKGDKGAIKKILENNKLDSYDLTSEDETAAPYLPTNYGKDETSLEIDEVISTIRNDEEFPITRDIIDDQWDSESRQVIAKNPSYITGLHNDIKAGIYDKVAPAAMKMKVLDGNTKSDIEYYMIAGEQFRVALEAETKKENGQKQVDELNEDAQSADSKFDKASSQANRKRSASSTGTRADRKGVIDYLDDDDEAFEEWYKKLNSSI